MIQYVCDNCGTIKRNSDSWILGFAAENLGVTSARREVTIAPAWDEMRAREWLAVHFCCIECKDEYIEKLFGTEPVESEVVGVVAVPSSAGRKVLAMTRRQRTTSKPLTATRKRKRG
jgi:hypothetical protein